MKLLYPILLLALLAGCQPAKPTRQATLNADLQAIADSAIVPGMPGILMSVSLPDEKFSWSGGAGYADTAKQTPIRPDEVFRIASVTKTFVAAAILRLMEDGKLSVDDPVVKYLAPEHRTLLLQGGYAADSITLRHLLHHSSGLFDHTLTNHFMATVTGDPGHVWTRTEQLREGMTNGHRIGPVGKQFSYSDTGYVLLGEVIEKVTGMPLGEAVPSLLDFNKLGLQHTYWEDYTRDLTDARIHQYFHNTDTYTFHPSIDLYGGGGLLSTTADLNTFFEKLLTNQVYHNPATLTLMLTPVTYATKSVRDYRMGIFRGEVGGEEVFTHTGFWGTQVAYFPKLHTCVAVNYSQIWKVRGPAPVLEKVVQVIRKSSN